MHGEVRVRFAPSPTGPLHIGGARSALFNWQFARGTGGRFILRIEDTDAGRSSRESEEEIMESLRWLGLDWDEGVDGRGKKGPYRQSERLHIYGSYLKRLLEEEKVYHCFCSEEELEFQRQAMLERGEVPRHMGNCRSLPKKEVEEMLAAGQNATLRFAVPPGEKVTVKDEVRGDVVFETDGIGDFIILKSDGNPTYNFAAVIDDLEMGITHVIRAEEHLSNTPRQILIYRALKVPAPVFAHISLILGEDRSKMSKRHGATSIAQYRQRGYLPEALVNFLALLGWSPEEEREFFSSRELVEAFSLKRVSRSPAVFDLKKLNWINAYYLKNSAPESLVPLAVPFLQEAGFLGEAVSPEREDWLARVLASVQSKMEFLAQFPRHAAVYFGEEKDPENEEVRQLIAGGRVLLEELLLRIDDVDPWEEGEIKATLKKAGKDLQVKGKDLFMPVRAAVSGQTWGPELPAMMELLGKEGVRKRIAYSLSAALEEGR